MEVGNQKLEYLLCKREELLEQQQGLNNLILDGNLYSAELIENLLTYLEIIINYLRSVEDEQGESCRCS